MTLAAVATAGTPAAETVRALVADDSPTNVFVLTAMLRSLGVATLSASDGAEAVEIAIACRPGLIFMDVQMPRMDGIAAALRIRGALADRRVAILAVTAYPDVRQSAGFKVAGFDDFLVKPVELPVLLRVVERWAAVIGADGRIGGAHA